MQQNALDETRFDEDLPKLLRAVERLGRSLEEMRREAKLRLNRSLRDRWTAIIDDKSNLVESWKESLAHTIQSKEYQAWNLRHALADMRAISRVMDFDLSWSTQEPEFSAATTMVFELAKPLDNALRPG